MKYLSSVSFFFLLSACAPGKEKVYGKIDDGIRTYMEKMASKSNKDLTIYELKTTAFDMISAGRMDTISKAEYTRKMTYFSNLQKSANTAAYVDSLDYYAKLDSLTTLQIANRWQDPKVYYYSKTYVNATIGNVRTADTIRYALDKGFRLVPILY